MAVSIDAGRADTVRPFMQKHNLSFTAVTDTEESISRLYQTTGVPESFLIDKNGIIVEKVLGPRDWVAPDAVSYIRNLMLKD